MKFSLVLSYFISLLFNIFLSKSLKRDYTALYFRWLSSSYSPPSETELSTSHGFSKHSRMSSVTKTWSDFREVQTESLYISTELRLMWRPREFRRKCSTKIQIKLIWYVLFGSLYWPQNLKHWNVWHISESCIVMCPVKFKGNNLVFFFITRSLSSFSYFFRLCHLEILLKVA